MIHHGDLFAVLPGLDAASVDACVTDPPYGIGFMGKEWDTFKPGSGKTRKLMHPREREAAKIISSNPNVNGRHRSPALSPSQIDYDYSVAGLRGFQEWTERWAREVFRVLKPGAYLVVCCAPRSYHRMACGLEDAGFVIRDKFSWLFGSGFPKNYNLGDGKGTALKPTHEPIALAWKPFKGTIKACHRAHGTAALNIEACRIESAEPVPVFDTKGGRKFEPTHEQPEQRTRQIGTHDLGRWPANVLLDEEAAALLDEQSGELVSGFMPSGGASRFYYVAKPSREERELGCHDLTQRQRDDSRKGGNPGGDNPRNRGLQLRGNCHPTVKPVELMRWLVRLVTPPSGIVLDPFTGSGTTGMACAYEQRRFIGIEREAEYVEIARRRIRAVAPLFTEEASA